MTLTVAPTSDEVRRLVAVAWDEYEKAVRIEGPADEWDRQVIDRVIHAFADQGHPFSANDFRELLPEVRTCLIPHRLRVAVNAGVIKVVGQTASALKSTHAHKLNVYQGAGT
mgnify:FL=1